MGLNILSVGIGGFIGSILRYIITIGVGKMFNSFPLGTLIVNITGGFLIGIILEFNDSYPMSNTLKVFLTTGIMGGLTTFSTFSFETISLFSDEKYALGSLNIISNVALSLFGVILGKLLIKTLYAK